MAFVQGGVMKNAEELKLMAHKIVNEYAGRVVEKLHATALEFSIYDALQDAYQKGVEEMRERARIVAWCHKCDERCKDIGLGPYCTTSVAEDIKALPLHPEGGWR